MPKMVRGPGFLLGLDRRMKMRVGAEQVLNAKFRLFFALMLSITALLADLSTVFAANVALQWDAVAVSGVAGYKVYYSTDSAVAPFTGNDAAEGASPVDVQNQTTTILTGLDPNKSYYFAVTAYDAAGNESDYSNIASVIDLTPPTVSINSPTSAASVSGTVAVVAAATDNVGVTKVEFFVNGSLQATETAAPYLFSWDTSALAPGNYTLSAKAYDAATNAAASVAVTVAVNNTTSDSTPPSTFISNPASNAAISGTVQVVAAASDNVAVSRVDLYLNGALRASVNAAPYSFSWDTTADANGASYLSCKAYDAAGNEGTSASITVTINNPMPNPVTINAAAAANGSISPLGATLVNAGATKTYTITPNAGFVVTNLVVDGTLLPGATSYTFSNVTTDHYINAYFGPKPAKITISAAAAANGRISSAGTSLISAGTSQTYTITPNAGYIVTNLVVDGVLLPGATSYTFTNVTADHYINAYFGPAPATVTITAAAAANGTISLAGATQVAAGISQTYTITPKAGYRVVNLVVDGTLLPGATSYAFASVTSDHYINAYFGPSD